MLLGFEEAFEQPTTLWQWAAISPDGNVELSVVFGLQADKLSAVFLCTITLAGFLTALHTRSAMPRPLAGKRFYLALLASEFAAVTVLLATNFLELLFFWELTAVTGWWLLSSPDDDPLRSLAAGKVWLVFQTADLLTVLGVFLIWQHFGTLELSAVLGDTSLMAEVVDRNTAAVTLIGLCLFGGVVGRCAQFPLFDWLDDACRAPDDVNALLQAATVMPLGVYLIVRCTPLFEASPDGRLLMAFVGGFTALLAAAVAVTQRRLQQVLGYTTSSHFGLMFLGLGSGQIVAMAGALFLTVVHILLKSSLLLAAGTVVRHTAEGPPFPQDGSTPVTMDAGSESQVETTSVAMRHALPWVYWSFLVAAVMLGCGLWGQIAVLNGVRMAIDDPPVAIPSPEDETPRMSPFAAEPDRLYQVAYWLGMASLLLCAFALGRVLLLTFHSGANLKPNPPRRQGRPSLALRANWPGLAEWLPLWLGSAVVLTLGLGAAATGRVDQFLSRVMVAHHGGDGFQVFQADVCLVPVLLGAVGAWMYYSRPTSLPQRTAEALGPFTRLSRNRFYLDQFIVLCVLLPLRGIAQLLRLFDWIVIDGLLVGLPGRLSAVLAKSGRPLQNADAQFDALSLLLAVGVLLTVLYWLLPAL